MHLFDQRNAAYGKSTEIRQDEFVAEFRICLLTLEDGTKPETKQIWVQSATLEETSGRVLL
jgi:hypothetical protein